MFTKLACRNVKRQIGNYLIYFITITLTVAMMFALCNLIFSEQLMEYAQKIEDLKGGLIGISIFVSIITAFILGYAKSYMLKLRKREFGTYLTLGMTRKNILMLFTFENLIICVVALLSGILLGLLLYQILMGLVAKFLSIKIAMASYSKIGLIMTVGLVCAMFILSAVTSAMYLRKATIYELMNAEKIVDKKVKHPIIWFIITIVSLGALIYSCISFYMTMQDMFLSNTSDTQNTTAMFKAMMIFSLSIVFYHIGVAKSIVNIMLKSKKIKSSGTNTFILRQLSGQLGANSILCGILAFLIAFAIIGTNISFGQKTSTEQFLNHNYPFDINANITANNSSPMSYEEAEKIIQEYSPIKETIPYNIYTSENNYLHTFTDWSGEGYDGLNDIFISEDDFNSLMTILGYEKVILNNEYIILAIAPQTMGFDFKNADLNIDGNTYKLKEVTDKYPILTYGYFLAVVPNEAIASMNIENEYKAINLENNDINAQELHDRLVYLHQTDMGYDIERCCFDISAYYKLEENSMSAILIVGMLYVSIIFVFMALAILTLKILSQTVTDKCNYEVLYRLGLSHSDQYKTLFRQLFIFFFMPFFLPMLMSIPTAFICGKIVSYGGFSSLVPQMYANSAIIALILFATYALYFVATYTVEKQNIIMR